MRAFPSALLVVWVAALSPGRAGAEEAEPPPPFVRVDAALESFRPWLVNEDWGVRALAAFELRLRTERGAAHLLAALLARETHPYAAGCALAALEGRPRTELVAEGGECLVEALLRLSRHRHPRLSGRALGALRTLPPVRLGDDPAAYEGWWQRGKDAFARERADLLRALGAGGTPAPDGATPATSVAPGDAPERFYGDLERMRRHGLEVVVVMDHTGSMGPFIGAAKAQALSLVRRLRAYVPGFRAGLVSYDDGARVRVALTHDENEILKALNRMAAAGGGDFEEGVDKGLRVALAQESVGWSRRAYRVIVVVGDAPPHEEDVPAMLRTLRAGRDDEAFERPVVVHAIAATSAGVEHFPQIALAGGGRYVTLGRAEGLAEELVVLSFGGGHRERVLPWIDEIDRLREEDPDVAPTPDR
jgi:Mg-chelatase subunit ChlD